MGIVRKILLIEDDNTLRSILVEVLAQRGFVVSGCMLLRGAAELLAGEPFDLVISDIGLPDGSGLDFCGQHKQTPFILMSGSEYSEQAEASGARAYLQKPFDVEDVLDAIGVL